MYKFSLGWLSMFLLLVLLSPAVAQDSRTPAAPDPASDAATVPATAAAPASPPTTFDELIDRVVER
jgi:hypothetical protein